jgi:hypothetical protein
MHTAASQEPLLTTGCRQARLPAAGDRTVSATYLMPAVEHRAAKLPVHTSEAFW